MYILKFQISLTQVVEHCETNKMTATNLSVVFGPNLAWAPEKNLPINKNLTIDRNVNIDKSMDIINSINSFIEFLITNNKQIYDL